MALGAIGGSKPGRGNTPWKNQGKTREGAELESAKAIVKALSSERQPPKRTFRTPLDLLNYIALIRSPLYESKSGATSPSTILKDPETAHRHIFSGWPRAPPLPKKSKDGKLCDEDMKRVLRPESSVAGKVAGNAQQIWGESLFDLYQTWRIPGVESYITWTSGSKMARWIEKYGSKEDKEVAEDALEWARDVEGDPRILFPKDVREAAREWEKKVEWGEGNAPPFSGPRPPKLQHRIMLHRLPKRLIVHDPYDLLGADETHFRKLRAAKATWPGSTGSAPTFNTSNARSDPPPSTPAPSTGPTTEVKDKTYVYNLHLSKAGRRKRDAELATLSQQRARIRELVQAVRDRPHTDAVRALLKEVRCGFVIPHFDLVDQGEKIDEVVARKGGKVEDEKWIFVMYGLPVWLKDDDATDSEKDETKKDDTSTSTSINDDETAHLYLSPSHPLGVGHHSIVYDAEWDLPRSTLFDGSILPPPTTLPDEVATVPIISMGTSTTKGVVCGQIGGTRAAGVGKADEPVDERHARAFRGLPGYGGTRGYSAFGREKDGFKAAHAPASASGSVGGREEEVYGDGAGGVDHIFDCDPVAGEMEPCVDGKDEWVVCKACVGERVRVWEEEKIKEKETGSASKGMGKERAEEKGYLELINTPAREPVYMPFDSPPPSPSSPSSPLPSNETKTTKSVYVLDPGALPTSSIRYTGPLELIDTGVEWVDLRDPGACEHLRSVGRRRWGGDEDEDGEGGGGWRFVARVGESGGESGGEDKDGDVHAGEQEKMEVEFEHGPENKEGSSRHVDEADESMKGIRLFAPGTVPKGAVVLGKIFVKVDEVRGGGLDEEAKMQAEAGLSRKDPRPTHVRTRLTAKLSLEHDDHLEKEAENYESFPGSFFERWNGFNILKGMHHPVPAGAIVPQYWGYWVEDRKDNERHAEESSEGETRKYRSPIMLLEHCGRQIDIDGLSIDDRRECASLFYRMHHQGWLHHSPYPRNVLVQEDNLEAGTYPLQLSAEEEGDVKTRVLLEQFKNGTFDPFDPLGNGAPPGSGRLELVSLSQTGESKSDVEENNRALRLYRRYLRECRLARPRRSFRVIDFGRSEDLGEGGGFEGSGGGGGGYGTGGPLSMEEEKRVMELFKVGPGFG